MIRRSARCLIAAELGALALSGCFAAVGPSIGVTTSDKRPTIGWEVSGATFAAGQTYAFGTPAPPPRVERVEQLPEAAPRAPEPPWARRTYLAWEPRFGWVPQGLFMAGLGATLGGRWDVAVDGTRMDHARFIGGGFAGAVIPIHPRTFDVGGRTVFYFSFAVGFRGDELYLAPKIGVLQEPDLGLL